MIAVSALWVVGNMLRLVLVELFGPPGADTFYDDLFQALTIVGLIGWVGFPAILIDTLAKDASLFKFRGGFLYRLVYLIPVTLLAGVLTAAVKGHIGPFTLEKLLVPILFYASCYIGGAALVS